MYGNHGTAFNAILVRDRFNNVEQAYSFNGFDAYLEMAAPLPSMANASFSVWIKPEVFNDQLRTVFFEGDMASGYDFGLRLSTTDPYSAFSKGGGNLKIPNSAVTVGQWMHVAAIFNYTANYCSLWVNGVKLDGSVMPEPANSGHAYKLQIGRRSGSSTDSTMFFKGVIDDLRIYNRALSDAEVQDLYAIESPSIPFLNITVKTMRLNLHVRPGSQYRLEYSSNLIDWKTADSPFTATSSLITKDVDVFETGRFWRLVDVP